MRWSATLIGAASLVGVALPVALGSPVAAAPAPITIGYIGDLTGVASSTFADGPGGARARVDAQNAKGGVNGHHIKLLVVDDQSNPTTFKTAVQDLVQTKHAFGIITDSAFVFEAAPYLHQLGVPVTGYAIDGPEWGQQPYTNMFDVATPTLGTLGGYYYASKAGAQYLKKLGVTKMAELGYGISPSATEAVKESVYLDSKAGIANCYENVSVPFGTNDFTADVLQIKQSGCNGVSTAMVDSSDVALAQAIKNAGLHLKAQVYATGYDDTILDQPSARAAMQGAYFGAAFNFTKPNAATAKMLGVLLRYDAAYHKGGIPDLGLYGSYLGADLMIKGLKVAGKNPTRASFISHLRKVSNYNAGGILSTPTTYRHFATTGMLPKRSCGFEFRLETRGFVLQNGGQPVCGPFGKVPPNA
jgi:branched-chain amino acid transport system substrate-binding protein